MTFTTAVRTCFAKYFTFSGRASRPEYWKFILFLILGSIGFSVIDALLFGTTSVQTGQGRVAFAANGPLAGLFSLATFIPALSAGWRRMHDSGRSGFYLLYPLIVMVGISGAILFFGGLETLGGDGANAFAAAVLIPATIVLAISPLLVVWWLARPTKPAANQWGPAT